MVGAIFGLSGLKVALGIQKQITAKREQVDLLQSRVKMLEETEEKLTQVGLFTSSSKDKLGHLGHFPLAQSEIRSGSKGASTKLGSASCSYSTNMRDTVIITVMTEIASALSLKEMFGLALSHSLLSPLVQHFI